MKTFPFRIVLVGSAVLALQAGTAEAGLWPFGKKAEKPAPSPGELQSQDAQAAELLAKAEASGGRGSLSIYKQIVSKYPLTATAATAQFRIAQAAEDAGKPLKAFEEYQALIDTYKASPNFADAIESQYNIAVRAETEKLDSLMGIKKKLSVDETLALFTTVVDNAPQGKHAAEAKFQRAKLYEDDGSTGAAITTYQDVVDLYPRSPLASEAQQKIAELNFDKVESGTRDASALRDSRTAANEAASLFPGSSASSETADLVPRIDEKEAENAFKIGKFYEKSGNKKAAIIYYNDVLRCPGGEHFEAARDRVNDLTIEDPGLLEQANVRISNKQLAVRADADVKSRPDYLGPPRPAELDRHIRKPKMRGSDATIPITPIEEPALPGEKPTGRPDDTLLQPGNPDLALPPSLDPKMTLDGANLPEEETKKALPVDETPSAGDATDPKPTEGEKSGEEKN